MEEIESRVHEWAVLVQAERYRYPNCWGPRLKRFLGMVFSGGGPRKFLIPAARAHPELIAYQVIAEQARNCQPNDLNSPSARSGSAASTCTSKRGFTLLGLLLGDRPPAASEKIARSLSFAAVHSRPSKSREAGR